MSVAFIRNTVAVVVSLFVLGCGGGGGGAASTPPPPGSQTVTIHYLRAAAAYDGWGLHLWGNAIAASTATTWSAPRPFDAIQNGAAVFNVPIVDASQALNFILHNGDLKSPLQDLNIVPATFGRDVWVVQDTAENISGSGGTPYANEVDARAALARLGSASAGLDFSTIPVVDSDSGLPADWASHANFIEIYVRGFQDSNGDGYGDLQGVISRLDWLRDQGYTGIWLMPIFRSADRDHGYNVADYRAIEPDYGALSDFDQLVGEAHARGIAVILDYVMNHGSSTHPIFVDATVGPSNPKRDWFVWSATHPSGWNVFSGDPWRSVGGSWYYAAFSQLVPDWNLRNPQVVEWHLNNLRFWLNRGADGFRFDAVELLVEDGPTAWRDAPETHVVLSQAKAVLDAYSKRYMVCEAPDLPADYARSTSCGRAFAFQAIGPLYASAQNGRVDAGLQAFLSDPLADDMPLILGNHDSFAGDRPWNRLNGNQANYKILAASYLLSSRTPFAYYGEDVGMSGGIGMTGDLALRVPMSWTSNAVNAGFTGGTPWRVLSSNSTTQNVGLEEGDANSLLLYYRALLNLRKQHPVLGSGDLAMQSAANEPVLRLTRESATECAAVFVNFSATPQTVAMDTSCANATFTAIFGTTGTTVADGNGDFTRNVPGSSALVFLATR